MPEPLLISRQRTALSDLYRTIAERARAEPIVQLNFEARNEAAENCFQDTTHRLITRFESEKNEAQKEFEDTQQRVSKRFDMERAAQDKEIKDTQRRLTGQAQEAVAQAKNEFQESRWTIATVWEAAKTKADDQLREDQLRVANALQDRKRVHQGAVRLLKDWRQYRQHEKVPPTSNPDRVYKDAFKQLAEAFSEAEGHRAKLDELRLPGIFRGKRPAALFLLPLLLAVGIAILVTGFEDTTVLLSGVAGAVAGACVAGFLLTLWLYARASSQIQKVYQPLCQSLADVEVAAERSRDQAKEANEAAHAKSKKRHEHDLHAATEKHRTQREAIKARRDAAWKEAQTKYRKARLDSTQRRDNDLRQAHEKYQRLRTEIFQRYETDSQQAHQTHFRQLKDSQERHEQEWNVMAGAWREGTSQVQDAVVQINSEAERLFPGWNGLAWEKWSPPAAIPPGIPFGAYRVDVGSIPDGLVRDARLKPALPDQFTLPALTTFPIGCSLLFKSYDEGRSSAVQGLQAVMLRFLTAIPPSKVRLTILDPVGLGENFAAFMHLADYDELLVTNRIWTEMQHMEQRLADLTGHMENVIQKYLRNQFDSIEDYNEMAGEVAEPYRLLVVANFPAGFSNDAARRLVSIATSGPRCGVYVLLTVDTKLDLPQGFNLADLEQSCVNLVWNGSRFQWQDPDFERWPLQLEAPPANDFCTRVLNVVGARAREAARVEVPFDFIAPPREQWWTSDSRGGINVPLGRAGATKRQHLKLGHGTSQHVLVAGKTGSGKSTLMHALITNLSLFYSPDEVELYLIDFKKGVEFKTYASEELPHARVVAIESEREFGLSVLQRLDAELKLRGEKFRDAGAQDLAGFRQLSGKGMPRILLVVDEFQEFFTDDDKIAQDCAQLLDRLVRQGRAFGLHVLLGSQTLGGAYSLARSTIDQMAVRIALQCSEADAHLILSDDNSAARLLTRPGEAIYNDANGLVEGNNPFQVVWLPEPRREEFLHAIRDRDRQHSHGGKRPQIVFEGNAPAKVEKNHLLHELLEAPGWPQGVRACSAWLGEAIAIKDPTTAVIRPQSGANLLLIGQQEDAALGILGMAIVSLAAQQAPPDADNLGARFIVLDGSAVDSPTAGKLGSLGAVLPHPLQAGGWRELPAIMTELADEVDRRQKSTETDGPAIYLIVYGLHRFRDLRKNEDDFGFSREEKPNPAKQFATLLREGPNFRIHTLTWCDNLNNLMRTLERQAMREFELRVLFQMSTGDSSNLIDTPAASKLGLHRALYHSEEEGKFEKFRPYGWPTEAWLSWVQSRLQSRQVAAVGS